MKGVIKTLLTESLFDMQSKEQIALLNEFLRFATNYLKISNPRVKIQFGREGLVTTASYGEKNVRVYAKDRALVDIMRSLAHELVHMKQDVEGRLDQAHHEQNNEAGSPIENEANSVAGVLIRKFGEQHTEIYN
jgi:hypothetical protein